MPHFSTGVKLDQHELPHLIIGACMEVHRHLGPGLMTEVYRECLAHELRLREIEFRRNPPMPVIYKGFRVNGAITVDFLIESSVILTLHETPPGEEHELTDRTRNILRLTGIETGLLVNFNVEHLRDGVRRIIVAERPPALHYQKIDKTGGP